MPKEEVYILDGMTLRFRLLILTGCLAGPLYGPGWAASFEWEAMWPRETVRQGLIEFEGAIEAENGDLYFAGQDRHGEYLARLAPDGEVRWVGHAAYPSGLGSRFIGIRETSQGIVTLWGCCAEPGWTAALYGPQGDLAGYLQLGFPRGLLDVSPEARVSFISMGQGSLRRIAYAEGRDFDGSGWKTGLGRATMEEVVGMHAIGSNFLAVLNRHGDASADTLKLFMLNDSGNILWSRDVPTGAKGPDYPGNLPIAWSRIAHDAAGRIILAGVVPSAPDSMALAAFSAEGNLSWLKRYPIRTTGDTVTQGQWEIQALSATQAGIRVSLSHTGDFYGSARDVSWSGESPGLYPPPPRLDANSMYVGWATVVSGSWIAIGSTGRWGGLDARGSPDTSWKATGIASPALFVPVPDSGGTWRTRPLPDYADTIWTQTRSTPSGEILMSQTSGPGLYFLLLTRDGGAVTGGRAWRRNGADTLPVIACKIPASEINSLPIRAPVHRERPPAPPWRLPFDAAGRAQREAGRSPVISFRAGPR